ncbi:acyltransferase [Salinactinospora qingdaonensis]|uniref:Acyltransferase family protein n=1 Tax=Salinactinospora qingdaonensis TaxID=702744 RepID=A0ABP7FHK1_9ACTN
MAVTTPAASLEGGSTTPERQAARSGLSDATPITTAWLDLTRIAAMFAVVVVHVFAPVVTTRYAEFGDPTWWLANSVDSAVRWCVPIFVMISGALLLTPRIEGLRSFYARRFSRIGVPLAVWTLVYLAWERLRSGISVSDAVGAVMSGNPSLHLYFLFVLAGLYLLTPFLRVLTRYCPRRMLWSFAVLMVALGVVNQAIAAFDNAGEPNAVTRFLPYVGYYVMGYLLREVPLTRRHTWLAGGVFVASVAATAVGAWALGKISGGWGTESNYLYDYLSPTVVVMSVAAFLLFRAVGTGWPLLTAPDRETESARRRLKTLADLSFGVFLVHVLVLYTVRDFTGIPDYPLGMTAMASVHLAVVLLASFAVTFVFRRTPWLRATV